jgi:hypothetical protein
MKNVGYIYKLNMINCWFQSTLICTRQLRFGYVALLKILKDHIQNQLKHGNCIHDPKKYILPTRKNANYVFDLFQKLSKKSTKVILRTSLSSYLSQANV